MWRLHTAAAAVPPAAAAAVCDPAAAAAEERVGRFLLCVCCKRVERVTGCGELLLPPADAAAAAAAAGVCGCGRLLPGISAAAASAAAAGSITSCFSWLNTYTDTPHRAAKAALHWQSFEGRVAGDVQLSSSGLPEALVQGMHPGLTVCDHFRDLLRAAS